MTSCFYLEPETSNIHPGRGEGYDQNEEDEDEEGEGRGAFRCLAVTGSDCLPVGRLG